jgi:hypothetical protein
MIRTVSQKMGIKENLKAYFDNPNKEAVENIHLSTLDI